MTEQPRISVHYAVQSNCVAMIDCNKQKEASLKGQHLARFDHHFNIVS